MRNFKCSYCAELIDWYDGAYHCQESIHGKCRKRMCQKCNDNHFERCPDHRTWVSEFLWAVDTVCGISEKQLSGDYIVREAFRKLRFTQEDKLAVLKDLGFVRNHDPKLGKLIDIAVLWNADEDQIEQAILRIVNQFDLCLLTDKDSWEIKQPKITDKIQMFKIAYRSFKNGCTVALDIVSDMVD